MASVLSVPSNWVFITGTTDASSRRRHLLAAAVNVQFSVQTLSGTAPALVASLVSASAPGGGLVSALNNSFTQAGLTAPTGVSAIPASSVTAGTSTTSTTTKSTKSLQLGLGIGLGVGLGLIVVGAVAWRLCLRPKAIEEGQKSAVQLTPATVMVPVVMTQAAPQYK